MKGSEVGAQRTRVRPARPLGSERRSAVVRVALPAAVAMTLLAACGAGSGGSPSATGSPSPAPSTAPAAPTGTPSASVTSAPSSPPELTKDSREALRAAMAAHPGADLDACTQETPLNDAACGAAITAADRVAADTARRLRQKFPEHAWTLHGSTLTTAAAFRSWLDKLRDPIPCYGLSDAPQPPPPLRQDARSICADAASIARDHWRLFLSGAGLPTDAPDEG